MLTDSGCSISSFSESIRPKTNYRNFNQFPRPAVEMISLQEAKANKKKSQAS